MVTVRNIFRAFWFYARNMWLSLTLVPILAVIFIGDDTGSLKVYLLALLIVAGEAFSFGKNFQKRMDDFWGERRNG